MHDDRRRSDDGGGAAVTEEEMVGERRRRRRRGRDIVMRSESVRLSEEFGWLKGRFNGSIWYGIGVIIYSCG